MSHVISDQVFGSSRRVRFIGMSPMDSLLSAIDKAHPSPSPQPTEPPMLPSLSSYLASSAPSSPSSSSSSNNDHQKSPTMSIKSLLDSPQQEAVAAAAGLTKTEANVASLLANPNSYLPPSPRMETIGMKRRQWSDRPYESQDDRAAKIRRCIREQISGQHGKYSILDAPPSPPHHTAMNQSRMVTITCLHAAVAQKSYGSEKRFLCPPPVVSIKAPARSEKSMERPSVSMSVICPEMGPDRSVGQRAILDETMTGSFKYLHVTGTAKAKHFQLKVQISHPGHANEPYATFDTDNINIISKPSKKTAKARNVSSCILSNTPVSLFNRINSQTVRTKYMTVERSQLCAKNSSWSAFSITVVRVPATATSTSSRTPGCVPVAYGAEIILTDLESGVSSEPLIIRKVEKGRIAQQAGGPVSQMQKVALQRVSSTAPGATPSYLSAAGAFTDAQPDQASNNANAFLGYESSRIVHTEATSPEGPTPITTEEVDDYLCWTIVGIAKFQHTYFESSPAQEGTQCNVSPFPMLTSGVYKPTTHSLEICTKDVAEGTEIWLGPHGPLRTRCLQSAGSRAQFSVELPSTQDVIVTNHDLLTPDTHGSRSLELPIFFVRSDGVVYHSGRAVRCRVEENGDAGRWCLTDA